MFLERDKCSINTIIEKEKHRNRETGKRETGKQRNRESNKERKREREKQRNKKTENYLSIKRIIQ